MNQDLPIKSKICEQWLYRTFRSPHLLKKPLRTVVNLPVNIIHPGKMNLDNGPDIRNAVLEINGIVQKGDIEFHLAPQDWFKHGHHEDRRYQNLILHVLWDAPQGIPSALLCRFPHLILCHNLSIPFLAWSEKMSQLEDEDSGVDRKIRGIKNVTVHQLKNFGQIRFIHKVERFQQWLSQFSFEEMVIISLAEVLGYSKNKFPMRELLWENPPSKIFGAVPRFCWSPLGIWVYLTMQANLLTAQSFNHLNIRHNGIIERTHQLFNHFARQGATPILTVEDWNFSRIRPANQPVIRLGALSQIIFMYQGVSLFKRMLESASKRLDLKHLVAEWKSCLNLPMSNGLGTAIQDMFCIPLRSNQIIGSQRTNQFIINAAMPLLYLWASRSHNPGFQHYISGLYEEFPACEDAKILRQFETILSNSSPLRLAIHQQGALELLAEQSINSMVPRGQMKVF